MTETVKQNHPVRGVLWGLMFGIGLALVLVVTTVISLDLVTLIVVVVVGTIVGVLWSIFGPAKAPKGDPPSTGEVAAPPESTRFDDGDFGAPADRPVTTPDGDD